jgi:site-specific DNA recombinase
LGHRDARGVAARTTRLDSIIVFDNQSPALNRVARLQGRSTPRASKTVDRTHSEWTEIGVPASARTPSPGPRSGWPTTSGSPPRNSHNPSLLQGMVASLPDSGYRTQ